MDLKPILIYYWRFLRKHLSSQVLLLVGYGMATIGTTAVIPVIYKELVNVVSENPPDAHERLGTLVFVLALTILLYNVFFRIADYFLIKSQSRIIKELHDHTLEKLQKHSYTFFSNAFVGGLVAKTKRFIHAFETLHDQFVFQIWMSGIALLISLFILWRESRLLGFAFLIWMAFYAFLVRFMVKWQTPKSLANAEADTKTIARYADIIGNIITIKMFGNEIREIKNFKKVTDDHEKKRTAAWMQQNFWNGLFQSITIGLFNIIIIWIAIDLWKNNVIPAGTIVLVQIYVLTSFNIVWSISKNIIRSSSALTDAAEMVKILEKEPGVKDPENPVDIEIKKGKIEFKNVKFAYEGSNSVFKKLNLTINPGEKVALVGHSGAGKTTIVKLLLRFIDIQNGTIEIDGQDITKTKQDELREQISYVPQDPLLFHRPLKENIGYADPDASFSEIVEAAKKANAHEFITSLRNGYDSLVGERGIKLSGGERQRVAIARAILKNSPIVVLDEATSSLDSIVEEKIQKALRRLIRKKTTIVIAHRLSTIREMDRIIVFDKGEIVESGTHLGLLKKKGVYSRLWKGQVCGFISG